MEKVIIKNTDCPHSRFFSKKLEYDPLLYVNDVCDWDMCPIFEPNLCNERCKEKMKKIVKITIEIYSKIFIDYFTDAKIIEGKKPNDRCDLIKYYYYLARNEVNDLYIPEYMNVGVVDGKTVRLCNNTNEYIRPQLPERLRAPLPPNHEYKEFKEYDDDGIDGIVYV
ncbi:hypothetical protein ACTFIR_002269 [Dictyostelium discoideum]